MSNGRKKIINKLIERDGNACIICGRTLDDSEMVIDHIVPVALGGNSEIDNLQLLCYSCNVRKGIRRKELTEFQFEDYICQLIKDHPNYSKARPIYSVKAGRVRADLAVERTVEGHTETIFCEIFSASSFTSERITSVIVLLKNFQHEGPETKTAFVFPGELAEKYKTDLETAGIEVWDKQYLVREFGNQIEARKESAFSKLILAETFGEKAVENVDKFQETINELKNCPCGKENWGQYQKLIGKIMEMLFCPELEAPIAQVSDFTRNNRRDFVLPNYSFDEIWRYLREKYCADYLVVDAKNSSKPITKADILQMGHYLKSSGAGLLGVVVSRKGISQSAAFSRRDLWLQDKKVIIVLNDDDIEQMLLDRKTGNMPAKVLLKKIEDFRLSI